MVFSILKAWLTAALTRRRLLDELADLSPEQRRDAGLDRSDLVLPRGVEPDGVMLQRIGWRAERSEVEVQLCGNALRISRPAPLRATVCSHPSPRFSAANALVAP